MKKLLLFAVVALTFGQLSAQKQAWKPVAESSISQLQRVKADNYSEKQQLFQVDLNALRNTLSAATDKFSGQPGVKMAFPNAAGEMEQFEVWENSNFAPELQAQYPEIRAYIGKNTTNGSTIHFSISPINIETMILRPDRSAEFIEPFTKDNANYVLFESKNRNTAKLPFTCSTEDIALNNEIVGTINPLARSNNQSYKTMRLALSCTGEYGAYFGGTVAGALNGMNNTMTRVNGVLEIDLSIHLNIIGNNDLVIYTNASSDPYSSASGLDNWNSELQANLTSVIGDANYDIGHLFGATGGGGNAGCIGCVCGSGKGSGYTSPSNGVPMGDTFDIDYVIHEMGHQMGANHTFSHNVEGSGVNVEPGSGSTIMGYAGITDYDVQAHSDAYFTYRSILQIQSNMAGKTCPVSTALTNTPPSVAAPSDFTVPSGTAYILKGIVSDAEGDTLSYCWEQNNSAGGSSTGANSVASPTKVLGPNYRSFSPGTTPDRYMPAFDKVLAGNLSSTWESVSTVARTLKFTLTVRDNHLAQWQTNTDEVLVSSSAPYNGTSGVGPFKLTSQATTTTTWGIPGSNETITWDVNNTTSLPGSAMVNIKMSLDNGVTWPITLASNTPNDGSEVITVPAATSTNCRLLIEPTGNVYYAVNAAKFAIGYQVVNSCTTYEYNGPAFNLGTSYTVKSFTVPISGTVSDVNIHVNATHPNLGNMTVAMIKPGGALYTIFNQSCSGSANMDVTFDNNGPAFACASPLTGTMQTPAGDLNSFVGSQQLGNWQFGFKSSPAGGTVNSFWMELCSQSLVPLATAQFSFNDFALYPNPNNGNFKVEFEAIAGNSVAIMVHDISGRRIFNKSYESTGMFSQEIQLSQAQAGIYLVSVSNGDQKVVKRIVVQ